jgi:putative membrane protein
MNTKIIANWFWMTIAVLLAAYILPGVSVDNLVTAIVVAAVLGILNTFIRPTLIFLSFPITVLTLGLFSIIINALLVLLASAIVPGFVVASFWWALLFSLLLSLVNALFHHWEK